MPKNFVRKTFDYWLKKNRSRFNYRPIIVKSRKDCFVLKFSGIMPCISCFISNWSVEIRVFYKGNFWDIIRDFDISERRTSDGRYFCAECLPEYKKFYSSRQELWIKHSFEPLLEWANENFISSNQLNLFEYCGGSTSAEIVDDLKLSDKKKTHLAAFFPVVNRVATCIVAMHSRQSFNCRHLDLQ